MKTKPIVTWVLVVVCLAAAAWVFAARYSAALAYRRSVEAAVAHSARLMQQLRGDPRFTNICFHVENERTAGVIVAHGAVETEAASGELHAIVAASRPPVVVAGALQVGGLTFGKVPPTVTWKVEPVGN